MKRPVTGRETSILIEGYPSWRHVYEWTRDDANKINGAWLDKIVDGVARKGDEWIPLHKIMNAAY